MKSGHPPNQDIFSCSEVEEDYPWYMCASRGSGLLPVSLFVSCQNETALYLVKSPAEAEKCIYHVLPSWTGGFIHVTLWCGLYVCALLCVCTQCTHILKCKNISLNLPQLHHMQIVHV